MKMTTEEAFVKVLQMHGIEHGFGIIGSLGHLVRPGERSGADSDEQLHQQCFLVGKVAVDRRPAYPGCRADVLQPHSEIAVPSHQPFRGIDQLVASIGLGAAAAGGVPQGQEGLRRCASKGWSYRRTSSIATR